MSLDDRLKQRLVGAIVLVALAVIFIPIILDGGRQQSLPPFGEAIPEKPAELAELHNKQADTVNIPPRPQVQERRLVDAESPPLKSTTPSKSDKTTPKVENTVAAADKRAAGETNVSDKGNKAWVVQVGSFKYRKNALKLRDRLRKHQYRAFVEAVQSNGNWTYRVRVGPEVRRSSAEQVQKQLLAKLKIKGVVMGHP